MAFQVEKTEKKGILHVRLIGSLTEDVDLAERIGPPPIELHVHARDLLRINSIGVRAWLRYFGHCSAKETRLVFHECSPTIIDQFNLIQNFLAGGEVVSLCAPFCCTRCPAHQMELIQAEEFRRDGLDGLSRSCQSCGAPAVLDDLSEHYFSFLREERRDGE